MIKKTINKEYRIMSFSNGMDSMTVSSYFKFRLNKDEMKTLENYKGVRVRGAAEAISFFANIFGYSAVSFSESAYGNYTVLFIKD